MQTALLHGPGRMSAIVTYDRRETTSPAQARTIAANLMMAFQSKLLPPNLRVLVAVGGEVLSDHAPLGDVPWSQEALGSLPRGSEFPLEKHDLLVQIAADSESDRVQAFKVLDTIVGSALIGRREIVGGRILNAQEHFGFPDGAIPSGLELAESLHADTAARLAADRRDVDIDAAIAALTSVNRGTWLFHLQMNQKVLEFAALPEAERAATLGRVPARVSSPEARAALKAELQPEKLPPNSHWQVMRPAARRAMLRRGFPCRTNGAFGMAFLAACENPTVVIQALDDMRGAGTSGPPDRLLQYASCLAGTVYFCPPTAAWLDPPVTDGAFAAELAKIQTRTPVPLTSYEMATSFVDYVLTLREAGLFEGPVGKMSVANDVQPHIDAIHQTLAARSGLKAGELKALEQESVDDANAINTDLDDYLTVS